MAGFDGSGNFTVSYPDFVANMTIQSGQVDQNFADIAAGLSTALCKDGQQAATANQPMGGYLHTNVGAATARTHYARASQVQDSSLTYLGTSSGTDTITASATPAITAYAAGQIFAFKAGGTNTGAATININGVAAIAVQINGSALYPGAITADDLIVGVVRDVGGTKTFQLATERSALVTSTAAEVTIPTQPAFLAFAAAQANATGDGTALSPVPFATEIKDQNGDYATTGIFTAPVGGIYSFAVGLSLSDVSNGVTHSRLLIEIITSNRTYSLVEVNPDSIDVSNVVRISASVVAADMDAGDTARVRMLVAGATKIVDITTDSVFSGRLAC